MSPSSTRNKDTAAVPRIDQKDPLAKVVLEICVGVESAVVVLGTESVGGHRGKTREEIWVKLWKEDD